MDRERDGPDHAASMDAQSFREFVKSIRTVEATLGHGRKEPVATEADIAAIARRALVAACDIDAGATIVDDMIIARRLGAGLPPGAIGDIIGKRATRPIRKGVLLEMEMFA